MSHVSVVRIHINPNHHLGYHFSDPVAVRHHRLDELMKRVPYAKLVGRLNAASVLLKNNSPRASAAAKSDMHYVQRKMGNKKKSKAPKKKRKNMTPKKRTRKSPAKKGRKQKRKFSIIPLF